MRTIFKWIKVCIPIAVLLSFVQIGAAQTGQQGFQKHCSACHPGGGNIMNKAKTLHKNDLEANNLNSVQGIVDMIRKGGNGMPGFDKQTIPDKEAHQIAQYVLSSF